MPSKGTAVLEVIARWQGEVIDFKTLLPGETLIVGPTPACDLIVPQQLLAVPTQLIQLDETGSHYTISLPTNAAQLTATEEAGGQRQGPGQHMLAQQHNAELAVGELSVQLQGAFASDPLPVWAPINWREQRGTMISAGLHLLVLALIAAVPPVSFALTADTFDSSFRFTPTVHQPLEEKDNPWLHKRADGSARAGKLAAKERGKMGDPKVNKRKRGAYDMKGTDPRNQPLGVLVKNMGVLGAINKTRSTTLALLLDPTQRAMSAGTEQALGGLIGDQIGPEYGSHGLALDGPGRGGGCTGDDCGLVGEGGGDGHRIGRLKGDPDGLSGWGNGKNPGGKGNPERVPRLGVGRVKMRGALSKAIIRRIVRRHLNEVRFCYQKQLQTNRNLRGRVIVNFVIAGNGTVALSRVSSESTLNNGKVETCVASAVRRWVFPKPEGGGIVTVSYPFTFHFAGS